MKTTITHFTAYCMCLLIYTHWYNKHFNHHNHSENNIFGSQHRLFWILYAPKKCKKKHIFYLHALKTIFKKHELHLVRFSHFTCGHNILAKLFYMIGCLDIQSNFTYIHFTGSFLSLFSFWLCNLAPCRAPVQIQSWVSDRACSGLSLQVWKFTNTCCFHHVF